MAFFSATVDTLLRNDLEHAYEDMAWGGQYAALIGLMQKEDFTGDAKKVPLKTDLGGGMSADAPTAYANATLAGRQAFVVTPFTTTGFSIIPLNQAAFTSGNDNSVVDLLLDESKTAMDSCKMQFDQALALDGSGTVATIVSHSGGGPYTLTLKTQTQCNRLTVNATYASKATAFAGSLDTGTFTITNIATQSKQITVTANGGWTPTDTHVFGLAGTVLASTGLATWPGIPGWIPSAANRPVASTAFFSVDRSVNEQKLAGLYLDATSPALGTLEAINQLAFNIANVPGSMPDLVVMSFIRLGAVVAQLQTQRRYVENSVQGPGINVFYKSCTIVGPKGDMDIVASSNWSEDLVAVLTKSTWVIASPGNKPFVPATANGNPIVEVFNDDKAVAKYRVQAIMYCTAPGHNGMASF